MSDNNKETLRSVFLSETETIMKACRNLISTSEYTHVGRCDGHNAAVFLAHKFTKEVNEKSLGFMYEHESEFDNIELRRICGRLEKHEVEDAIRTWELMRDRSFKLKDTYDE